jgi:hypothetical protein
VCGVPYWGIPTADTTTPLSDDNASDPTRKGRNTKSTAAPETEGARPVTAARRPAEQSVSATRSPRSGVPLPPTPVWAAEPTVTPKWADLPDSVTEVVPPPIPNWEQASASTSWPDALYEQASSTTRPPLPAHSAAGAHHQHNHRTRAFTTTVVLASLFVIFVAVTLTLVLLHHSDNPPARTASTAAATSPDTARLQAATKTMGGNLNATRAAFHSLKGIPTIVVVAGIIDPYVSSLQHYQTVLAGAKVPTSARAAAANVRALLSGDAQSLATIHGLPPIRLGTYLEDFLTSATQLQKDLGTLEHALGGRTG